MDFTIISSILEFVTITIQLQLKPTAEQKLALEGTLTACNAAADWISERGWDDRMYSQFALQTKHYKTVRSLFGIGAQAACLIFAKVADAYKLDKKTQRKFRPFGAIAFDIRNLKLYVEKQLASIWTVEGREKIPFVMGDYQKDILARGLIKQCDLVRRRDGRFFLMVSVTLPDEVEQKVTDMLGVDLGISFIAADSDGNLYSGKKLNKIRHRNQSLRRKLQRKGTKSARRLLKKRSLKESRFARDTNHTISKQIVSLAKRTGRGISIENLTGIRDRIRARKAERTTLHSWAFHQMGQFLAYKAKRAGIPLVLIDPRNTSRRCTECGHTEKANRKTRDEFLCRACGHSAHSDTNGSENIRLKGLAVLGTGVFNHPNVGEITAPNYAVVSTCKQTALA